VHHLETDELLQDRERRRGPLEPNGTHNVEAIPGRALAEAGVDDR
jgi:hypothetical protein